MRSFTALMLCLLAVVGCQPEPTTQPAPPASAEGPTETVSFAVDGMHCEACAGMVSEFLLKVPGVQSADVSVDEKKATVVTAEGTADFAKMQAAVKEAGYEASELPKENGQPAE